MNDLVNDPKPMPICRLDRAWQGDPTKAVHPRAVQIGPRYQDVSGQFRAPFQCPVCQYQFPMWLKLID